MTDPISTRVGRAERDEHLFYGHRVFGELAGRLSGSALTTLAITGVIPRDEDVTYLDALSGILTVADPRIWPLKLVRLLASNGSILMGLAGGALTLDSEAIGPWTAGRGARALVDLEAAVGALRGEQRDAQIVAYFAGERRIVGFGVPVRTTDERVVALRDQARRLGRAEDKYWGLAEDVWRLLRETRSLEPNIGSAMSASLLDAGIPARHVPTMAVALTWPTLLATAVEGASQRAERLRRLPSEGIRYVGVAPRTSPRATPKF